MNKTVGIIQARMNSSRLPGKVLLPILGRPMIELMYERVKSCRRLDQIGIATTDDPLDDSIAKFCQEKGIDCFRGNESDVLQRYFLASKQFGADTIVRLTGDCPLMDPAIIDGAVDLFMSSAIDFLTNGLEATFPDGLDLSVFTFRILESAFQEARLKSEREHVVPWMWKNLDIQGGHRFKGMHLLADENLQHMRWTVDDQRDFSFVTNIFEHFSGNIHFSWRDVLDYLRENPKIMEINSGIIRDEGYLNSLKSDGDFK